MISEAAQHGLEIDYFDVITASLNSEVNENVYMALPKGVSEATGNTVDKLKKASYGFKTAPRLWHKTINASPRLNSRDQKLTPIYIYI